MGPDVAQGARAGLGLVQAPRQRRLRVDDPVLEVLRPHVVERAEPALGHELAGQGDGRDPTVGEAHHRAHAVGRGLRRRRRPSPLPPRRSWPTASRTGRACLPRARRSRSRRGCRPGCTRRRGRCRRGRPGPATTSRSTPIPAVGGLGDALASRPARAVIRRRSGRSKNRRRAAPGLRVGCAHEGVADHADRELAVDVRRDVVRAAHRICFLVIGGGDLRGGSAAAPGMRDREPLRRPVRTRRPSRCTGRRCPRSRPVRRAAPSSGTSTSTRSLIAFSWSSSRASFTPSAPWVDG